MSASIVLVVITALSVAITATAEVNDTLTLSVLLPLSSQDLDGRPYLPAMDIALELINNRTDILPGYHLQAVVNDSACSASPSVRSFIDTIFNKPTKVAMVGPICSTATQPVAELASFWNLVLISAGASNPTLSNTEAYPTFLRSVSPDTGIVDGIISLMKEYQWSRVATITLQEFLFTTLFSELSQAVMLNNLTEVRNFQFGANDNPQPEVEKLYNSPFRIIFLNMYPIKGIEVICQAYELGMTRENGYVWILFSWYGSDWWTRGPIESKTYNPFNCTQQQREAFVEGAFLIDHFAFVEENEYDIITDVGLSYNQYFTLYNERIATQYSDIPDLNLATAAFTPLFVDAIWTIALALNATENKTLSLKDFTYDSVDLRRAIYSNAISARFLGLSGLVSFKPNGDRYEYIRYFQTRRMSDGTLSDQYIGHFDNSSGHIILRDQESTATIFFDGVIPVDEVYNRIDTWIFIVYVILALAGMIYSTVWLVMNVIFRKKKTVKLSSPYLNIVIISGAMLFYLDMILLGLDEALVTAQVLNGLCMTRMWLAVIAFTLLFGTLFAKTWRVYYIFHTSYQQKKSKKWIVHDGFLFLIIGILLIIDCLFLTCITAIPATRLELNTVIIPSTDHSLPIEISSCSAQYEYHWLGILFAYKGLFLIVGLFLAFETRNVKIRELNDSHLIVMCVYTTVVLSVSMTPIGIFLTDLVDVHYGLIGLFTMFGVTLILSVLFIPKAYNLVKDPNGEMVFSQTAGHTGNLSKCDKKETTEESHQSQVDQWKHQMSFKSRKASSAGVSVTSLNSNNNAFGHKEIISDSKQAANVNSGQSIASSLNDGAATTMDMLSSSFSIESPPLNGFVGCEPHPQSLLETIAGGNSQNEADAND